MAGFSLVGRTQCAQCEGLTWWTCQYLVIVFLCKQIRQVEPPIFNFTDRVDHVKPSLFANFLTSPDVSHQSLSGIFVSTFLFFGVGI